MSHTGKSDVKKVGVVIQCAGETAAASLLNKHTLHMVREQGQVCGDNMHADTKCHEPAGSRQQGTVLLQAHT
jgi:hypothetical protein